MPVIDNSYYIGIGDELYSDNNTKNHRYYYSQSYTKLTTGNPFESLMPSVDEFWGPKVLNILLITQNYDWNASYIAAQLEIFKGRWINFEDYQAKIWVDLTLAAAVDLENGNSDYTDDMLVIADDVEAICAEMEDYGWLYMGTLDEQKSASFFQPYITEFYGA